MFKLRNWLADRWPPADARVAVRVHDELQEARSYEDPIARLLALSRPGLIGRFGGTEARLVGAWLRRFDSEYKSVLNRLLWPGPYGRRARQLRDLSGVYPVSRDDVDNFIFTYLEAFADVDVLGVWGRPFTWPEQIYAQKPEVAITHIEAVAPWVESWDGVLRDRRSHLDPWSTLLSGRRVLVVSPFSNSVERQFRRIGKVFPDSRSHDFELVTVQAPMTLGGLNDDRSWGYHLARLQDRIMEIPHDISLVSAGAASMGAAAASKRVGSVGVHCGGGLQLFFGILGRRWERNPNVMKHVNEYWVRPTPDERPLTWTKVEGGCYW